MKKKLNIVDIVVILLVIVFFAGIGIRFMSISHTNSETVNLTYTVLIKEVRGFSVDAMKQSNDFSDGVDTVYGTVAQVKDEPCTKEYTTSSGDIVQINVPDKYNCYVTLNADVTKKGNIYYLSEDDKISVGEDFELITKYVKSYGQIVEVVENK